MSKEIQESGVGDPKMQQEKKYSEQKRMSARVFISYSRTDSCIAEPLRDLLIAAGVDAYLDQHDIAPGEAWKERLHALIANAEKVIFLISPEAAASPMCAWEVETAENLGKPIVPTIVRDAKIEELPQGLIRLNFIFYRDEAERSASFPKLVEVLNTDLDWEREKTRINDLAVEWRDAGEPRHRLVTREDRIREMETWRDMHPRNAPAPTEIQLNFISQSRRAFVIRQRQIRVGLAVIGLFMTIATGVAVLQRQEAISQKKIANDQRDEVLIQQSEFLVSQGERQLSQGNAQAAIQLAIEALPDPGGSFARPYVNRAEVLLNRALSQNRELALSYTPNLPVYEVELNVNGEKPFVFFKGPRHAEIIGLREDVATTSLASFSARTAGHSVNHRINQVAIASWDGSISILDSSFANPQIKIDHGCPATSVDYSSDGTRLISAGGLGRRTYCSNIKVWNTRDYQLESEFSIKCPSSKAFFSRDGSFIVSVTASTFCNRESIISADRLMANENDAELSKKAHGIVFYSAQTGELEEEILFRRCSADETTLSLDKRFAILRSERNEICNDSSVQIVDLIDRTVVANLKPSSNVTAATFLGESLVLFGHESGVVTLHSVYDGSLEKTFSGLTSEIGEVTYDEPSSSILAGDNSGSWVSWSIDSGNVLYSGRGAIAPIDGLSRRDGSILTASLDGTIRTWSLRTQLPIIANGYQDRRRSGVGVNISQKSFELATVSGDGSFVGFLTEDNRIGYFEVDPALALKEDARFIEDVECDASSSRGAIRPFGTDDAILFQCSNTTLLLEPKKARVVDLDEAIIKFRSSEDMRQRGSRLIRDVFALQNNSDYIVVGSDHRVYLVSRSSGLVKSSFEFQFEPPENTIMSPQLIQKRSPDGDSILVFKYRDKAFIAGLRIENKMGGRAKLSGHLLAELTGSFNSSGTIKLSNDENHLIIYSRPTKDTNAQMEALNLTSGITEKISGPWELQGRYSDIKFSRDMNSAILLHEPQRAEYFYFDQDMKVLWSAEFVVSIEPRDYFDARFNKSGRFFALSSGADGVELFEVTDGRSIVSRKFQADARSAEFFPISDFVLFQGKDFALYNIEMASTTFVSPLPGQYLWGPLVDPRERFIFQPTRRNQLILWPVYTSVDELIVNARQHLVRCLSGRERREMLMSITQPPWCAAQKLWPFVSGE